MFALVADGVVVDMQTVAFQTHELLTWHGVDAVSVSIGWTFDGATFHAPVVVEPSPIDLAARLLAGGLAVNSLSTPSINATYPCDQATLAKLASIEIRLAAHIGFPSGEPTQPWRDMAGQWHVLTASQFASLAAVVSAFVAACDMVIDGYPDAVAPTNTATIP